MLMKGTFEFLEKWRTCLIYCSVPAHFGAALLPLLLAPGREICFADSDSTSKFSWVGHSAGFIGVALCSRTFPARTFAFAG